MKKIFSFICLLFLSFIVWGTAHASEASLVLISEDYFDGELIRTYLNSNGEEVTYTIYISEDLIPAIENSNDLVLEAKKQLFAAYSSLDLKEKVSELRNEQLYLAYTGVHPTVSSEYKAAFDASMEIASAYAIEQANVYATLSLDEQMSLYNPEDLNLIDYSNLELESYRSYTSIKEESDRTTIYDEPLAEEKSHKGFLVIFSIFLILALVGGLYFLRSYQSKRRAHTLEQEEEERLRERQEEENLEGIDLLDGIEDIDEFHGFNKDK